MFYLSKWFRKTTYFGLDPLERNRRWQLTYYQDHKGTPLLSEKENEVTNKYNFYKITTGQMCPETSQPVLLNMFLRVDYVLK